LLQQEKYDQLPEFEIYSCVSRHTTSAS